MDAVLVEARWELAERLRERREEIELAIATRVFSISEPRETADPEYLEGLRASLGVALEFAFAAIGRGETRAPEIPPALLGQARMAARSGVSLDTVLRRYLAGYSLMLEFILDEAEAGPGGVVTLRSALRGHAAVFDRLVAAVSEEHRRETTGLLRTTSERRAERVRRLLAGEPIDVEGFGYDLEGFHIGLAGAGPGVESALGQLAEFAEASQLTIALPDTGVWAWLGRHRPFARQEVTRLADRAANVVVDGATLALGEPAQGLAGWRLSHRQAVATLTMTRRLGQSVIRYADVGLLASVSADDLLLESLRQMYLAPLAEERDGGEALRSTLASYLRTGRNMSSTAAFLGVNRETVRKRLRTAEERIGRSIDDCAAELEIALRLDRRERSGLSIAPEIVAPGGGIGSR